MGKCSRSIRVKHCSRHSILKEGSSENLEEFYVEAIDYTASYISGLSRGRDQPATLYCQ